MEKLVRLYECVKSKKKYHLVLTVQDMKVMKWRIDMSFSVHTDFRSGSGLIGKFG